MALFHVATRVEYKTYLEVEADNINDAYKIADQKTFDQMNDEAQPTVGQYLYNPITFEEVNNEN